MNKCTLCVVQHSPCETLGRIANALPEQIALELIQSFKGQPVPAMADPYQGLILMGGPVGVYDSHPFLKEELRLIEQALKQNKPILGVCLGSQLLAAALGARVYPGKQKEIGWKSVRLNDFAASDALWQGVPRSFTAFHWHGDLFDLPTGAVPLAESDLAQCQAFRYGKNAYGLLFHAEVTTEIIQGMVKEFAGELEKEGIKAEEILGPMATHLANLQYVGTTVFGRWASLVSC